MSVINKMLRDLDERHALAAPDGTPASVQAGPEARRRRDREWFWRIVSALMLGAVAWVGWIAYQLQPQPLVTDLALRSADVAHRLAARKVATAVPVPATPVPVTTPAAPVVTTSTPTSPAPQAPAVSNAAAPVTGTPGGGGPAPAAATPAAATVPSMPPSAATTSVTPADPARAGSRATTAEASSIKGGETSKPRPRGAVRQNRAAGAATSESVAKLALDVPAARILSGPAGRSRINKRDTVRTPAQRAEIEFRKGVALLREGRPSESEENFGKALELSPAHEAARQAYAALLIDRRAYPQARTLLEQGLVENPGHPLFSLVLARLRVEQGALARALEVLDASRGGGTEYAEIQALRGTVLHRLARHPAAADAYRSALQLAPGDGASWVGLALSLEAMQNYSEAAEAFLRAAATGTLSPEMKANAERRARQIQ